MRPINFRHWAGPSAAGLAVGLLALALFTRGVRIKPHSIETIAAGTVPALTLGAQEDAERVRQELLSDLEPLFLPTEHNTSVLTLPIQVRREPGAIALTLQPKLTISESGGGVYFPDTFSVPTRPSDTLQDAESMGSWTEFGRRDVEFPPLPDRLAYVEVRTAKSGDAVLQETVTKSADAEAPTGLWAPLEFLVAVDAVGIVGSPVITDSTPTEEVETFFRNFVVKKLRLGARLAPGFYTVRIGP